MTSIVSISEFCKTGSGGTPSRKTDEYFSGTIPWIKSGELRENIITESEEHISEVALKESSAKLIPAGAILVAMYGATVGRMGLLGVDAATNQAVCNIIPDKKKADMKYVFHALQAKVPELLKKSVGGAQPNISQQIIKETKIPLPPLPEQKRIAAILDKADAIRRKRRQALALADQFLQAVFLEMFGDPVTNPKGWKRLTMAECVYSIESGWSANGDSRSASNGEIGVLKISSVTSGHFRPDENKVVTGGVPGKKLIFPQKGDLLFSRANTRDLVAATCIVGMDQEKVFLPDKLWRINLDSGQATPEFIKFLLTHSEFRSSLTKRATGTSGSMLNISKEKLLETTFPSPPIALQRQFSSLYWRERTASDRRHQVSMVTETLFSSLTQRAFRGEL
ncbi:MAG: restriction endonuclease subunit S [Magnetococcales bacterium]|nr:restriction endonuclease subunit S [Magnetococcales bacterium]